MSNEILRGPRARIAGTVVFVAGIASACGTGGATETLKPTVLPTEKPTTSTMVTPTPEASPSPEASGSVIVPTPSSMETPTATPTPEVTPTPEATPSPNTLKSIIEGKPKKLTAAQIKNVDTELTAAWNNNPQIKSDQPLSYMLTKWQGCQVPSGEQPNPGLDKELKCRGLIAYLGYTENNPDNIDPYSYKAIKDVFNFAETTLPAENAQDIVTFFKGLLN